VDDEIQRGLREDDLRAAVLLRRAGRIGEALDRLEAAFLVGSEQAHGLFLETLRAVPEAERLAHAARLDRLACHELEAAERLWREWFRAAARIVGRSAAMQRNRAFVYENARRSEPILIAGAASGVGHDLTAETLHILSGRERLFVVKEGAYPVGRFADELSRVRAGDTFYVGCAAPGPWEESAHQLARERSARLIVGSYQGAESWAERRSTFVAVLELPFLYEHLDDLPELVRFLLDRAGAAMFAVRPALIERLRRYNWPGGIRELDFTLQRLVILADSRTELPLHELPEWDE